MASVLFICIAIYLARRFNQTIYTCIAMTGVSLIGLIVLMANESNGGKLAGYYLTWALTAAQAMMITIIGNNVSGYTKKVILCKKNRSSTFGCLIKSVR
jgi:O-antigen/teichoic acid export membrane protein